MKAIEKHPLWVRILHWMNVPFLSLMIWSGLLIYWADNSIWFFFPKSFYELLGIPYRLAEGLALHFTVAWLFVLNGLCYLLATLISKHKSELIPNKKDVKELPKTIAAELRPHKSKMPKSKFNAAQKIAYCGIVAVGILEVATGFAIYKPIQLSGLVSLFGGYESARRLHFICMILFVGFVLIHVLQVIRAGWNNFRAMVAGFEINEDNHDPKV